MQVPRGKSRWQRGGSGTGVGCCRMLQGWGKGGGREGDAPGDVVGYRVGGEGGCTALGEKRETWSRYGCRMLQDIELWERDGALSLERSRCGGEVVQVRLQDIAGFGELRCVWEGGVGVAAKDVAGCYRERLHCKKRGEVACVGLWV